MNKAIVGAPGNDWRIRDQLKIALKITIHLQLDLERDQIGTLFGRVNIPRS